MAPPRRHAARGFVAEGRVLEQRLHEGARRNIAQDPRSAGRALNVGEHEATTPLRAVLPADRRTRTAGGRPNRAGRRRFRSAGGNRCAFSRGARTRAAVVGAAQRPRVGGARTRRRPRSASDAPPNSPRSFFPQSDGCGCARWRTRRAQPRYHRWAKVCATKIAERCSRCAKRPRPPQKGVHWISPRIRTRHAEQGAAFLASVEAAVRGTSPPEWRRWL